jgi:hypothetical protein
MPSERDGSAPYIEVSKEKREQDNFGQPWNPVMPRVHNEKNICQKRLHHTLVPLDSSAH